MITVKYMAPSSRLSPTAARKLNNLRLNIDIFGLTIMRAASPFILALPALFQQIISVYNVMALITILAVDPTKLPEAATTRIKQKEAWLMLIILLPLLVTSFGIIVWLTHLSLHPLMFPSLGAVLSICIDELLFRNILQPKLRKSGFNKYAAIIVQSIIYASMFLLAGRAGGLVGIALLLGLVNGWFVYTYRSLWPAIALSFVVHLLILSFK
jgi:membrane protease YdiL (CAAX protease family)